MTGREQLAQYIGPERGARAAFARKAKMSLPHLVLYLTNKRRLSVPMAERISGAADGKVSVLDLVKTEDAA